MLGQSRDGRRAHARTRKFFVPRPETFRCSNPQVRGYQTHDDLHSQRVYAQNTTSSDLAIVISYSGTTPEIVGCARTAKNNGTKVVAITCGAFDSPLARISDYVLGVAATELLVRSGAMSSRIAQLNVVDVLFASYVASNYERCMRLLTSNRIIKPCNSDDGRSLSRKAAPDD